MLNKELLLAGASSIISIKDTLSITKDTDSIGRYFTGKSNVKIPWFLNTKGQLLEGDVHYSSYHEDSLHFNTQGIPSMTGWHRIIFDTPISASTTWIPIVEGVEDIKIGRYKYNHESEWNDANRYAATLCQWSLDVMGASVELYYTQPPHDVFYNLYNSLGSTSIYMDIVYQFSPTPQGHE